jgi:hypothetical protein
MLFYIQFNLIYRCGQVAKLLKKYSAEQNVCDVLENGHRQVLAGIRERKLLAMSSVFIFVFANIVVYK